VTLFTTECQNIKNVHHNQMMYTGYIIYLFYVKFETSFLNHIPNGQQTHRSKYIVLRSQQIDIGIVANE